MVRICPELLLSTPAMLQKNIENGTFRRAERVRDVTAYLPYSDGKDVYPLNDFDKASAPYLAFKKEIGEYEIFLKNQADSGVRSEQASGIRLWRQFGRGTDSLVLNLEWSGPDTLFLQLTSGIYTTDARSDFQNLEKTDHTFKLPGGKDNLPEVLKKAHPPARQGRQFKAQISAWASWDRHTWMIGTDDGCVALYHEKTGSTYSLGAVGVHGPVHQISCGKRSGLWRFR